MFIDQHSFPATRLAHVLPDWVRVLTSTGLDMVDHASVIEDRTLNTWKTGLAGLSQSRASRDKGPMGLCVGLVEDAEHT